MFAPDPASIHWADVYRDGGTYQLVYFGRDGVEYELQLPVIFDPKVGRVGYRTPKICARKEGELGAPILLSWQEASILSKQLAPLVGESIEMGGAKRATECIRLLSLGGQCHDA